jgi:hypothetical protein
MRSKSKASRVFCGYTLWCAINNDNCGWGTLVEVLVGDLDREDARACIPETCLEECNSRISTENNVGVK